MTERERERITKLSFLKKNSSHPVYIKCLDILEMDYIFLFIYSDDEDEDEDDQFAVAATFGSSLNLFKTPKTSPVKPSSSGTTTPMGSNKTQQQNPQKMMQGPSQQNVDKERLTVDISALRQQYRKLRQRQQQAHIILTCK